MRENTILVVVDPAAGQNQPVLARAGWLAKESGARLELFACDYDSAIDSGRLDRVWQPAPGAREQLLARHRRNLEELARPLRDRGLTVTADVVWGHPLDAAIIRKAAAHDYWLVAKGTHHHNVLQRTLLTQTDWHLIRRCPAPLLLVKDRPLSAEPNVLAAVDPLNEHDKPAALDDRIFNFGADLARIVHGRLHVVHAFSTPMGVELPPDVRDILANEHRHAMAEFLGRHPTVAERSYLYEGLAHESLQLAAKEHGADFVVMGAVARSGLKRLFIGSTAERVLDRLPCDLVIIKPLDFELPEDGQ
jgi:universal stress protein E